MLVEQRATDPQSFTTFGEMLRYLRRRARLTQRDLGIAVGYSEGHINRFEKDKHLPDLAAVTALFIPALQLEQEPRFASRLVELSQTSPKSLSEQGAHSPALGLLEAIPPAPPFEVARPNTLARTRRRLSAERRILLAGLAGVGKTTLAATLAREASASMPVFWFTFTQGVTTQVDILIHQLAIFLAEQGHSQLKTLLQSVPNPTALALDRVLIPIGAALNRQPVLLCFDNLEAIGSNAAVLQVLRHLCATTSAEMVLTSRESLSIASISEITLTGLDPAEGLELIETLCERRLSSQQAAALYTKTGGSPMLIRLAVAHLADEQKDTSTWIERLDTQPQVAAYLLEMLQAESSPAEWQILSLLAVFQKPVNLYDPALRELAQFAQSAAIANLQRRHLIDDAARAELNPLVRDYVTRMLGAESKRRRLHRLAGDWYAGITGAALSAAEHYAQADLLDETVETITQNEKEIITHGEGSAAVAILDEVFSSHANRRGQADDALRRLLTIRGDLLGMTSRSAEAEANLRQALSLTSNPAIRADLVYRMRMVLAQRGQYADALQLIQAARAELSPADVLLGAQLCVAESRIQELIGDMAEASQCAEQAIALANQVAHISPSQAEELRAEAYYTLANVARRNCQVDVSIEYAQCALTSAGRAGLRIREVSCLAFIGGILYDSGDLEGALHYRRDALAGAQAIEDQVGIGYYLTHLAGVDTIQLHAGEALKKLDLAVSILSDTGEIRGLASALGLSTINALLQGNIAQASAAILRVLNDLEVPATQRAWGAYLNKLAMVQMVEDNVDGARATLERALALPSVATYAMLHFELDTNLALMQAMAGEAEAARRTLDQSPRMDGLNLWTDLDRDLVEGCVAFACGQYEQAAQLVEQIARQSRAYPLYLQSALRLAAAFRERRPARGLPHLLWVGID